MPGYGKSWVLDAGPWHKRAAGDQLVTMMRSLGHDRFAVIGHDRGARVGYRLALDYPEHVSAYWQAIPTPSSMPRWIGCPAGSKSSIQAPWPLIAKRFGRLRCATRSSK